MKNKPCLSGPGKKSWILFRLCSVPFVVSTECLSAHSCVPRAATGGSPLSIEAHGGHCHGLSPESSQQAFGGHWWLSFPTQVRRPRPRGAQGRVESLALTRPLLLSQILGTQPCNPSLRPETGPTGHASGGGPVGPTLRCSVSRGGPVRRARSPPTHTRWGHRRPSPALYHLADLTHLSAS